jgi:2-polyprenyl-6-methoxyphenol hydroxylase-like FAD-dependent oxidoreductase
VNVSTGDYDEIGFASAATGKKVGSVGGKPFGEPGALLRVSREGFRAFLWQGLEVETGKQFTHYTASTSGQTVTAHFSDGSSATGSLLIGADGAHSKTIDQLVGKDNHKPVLSNIVPIMAEADLPLAIYEPLRKLGNAVILATAQGVHLQMGMMSMAPDRSRAHYYWAIMPRRENPKELSDWVTHQASKQELYDFVVELTKDLHPLIKDLVNFGGQEALSVPQVRFLEFEPPSPEAMKEKRVIVLGDAAHSMIPFRGAGANTAILDACDLGGLLVEANKEGKDFAGVLPQYHELMVPRGQENIRSSHAAGEMDERQWAAVFRRP